MPTPTPMPEWPAPAPGAEWTDIEWRIDSAPFDSAKSSTGHACRWVPYLNATTCARLLDAWVGPDNWSDTYETVQTPAGNGVECVLTIHGVSKRDIGVSPGGDADMAVKGIYSDAFKRVSIIKWGIGRNVYAMESEWAPCGVRERDGKKIAVEIPESMDVLKAKFDERPL